VVRLGEVEDAAVVAAEEGGAALHEVAAGRHGLEQPGLLGVHQHPAQR